MPARASDQFAIAQFDTSGKLVQVTSLQMNGMLDAVAFALAQSDIPHVVAGKSFFRAREISDLAAMLALVLEPKLLLADEPTGNLDSGTSSQIHELFFAINKQRGTTIVVVTHNMALADRMPRVVTLRDGKVERDERAKPAAPAA